MNNIIIRKETKEDYWNTEYMVMRAFWNLQGPGCNEHLIVRLLHESEDYLPEYSRVAELDGRIVGCIIYSRAWVDEEIVDAEGNKTIKTHNIATFGPLAVEPTLANAGIGKMLLEETLPLVKEAGYPGVVILGEPGYYPKRGFKTTEEYEITCQWGYVDALLAYKLSDEFDNIHGKLRESEVFEKADDEKAVEAINKEFPYHKPLKLDCQWLHVERLGRISEVQKNNFTIKYWEKELPAKLKGSFFKENKELPVVGDYVTFRFNPIGDSLIESVCERSSMLKRPDQSGHSIGYVKNMQEQVMVANFDYVFIVASLNDNYNYNRIARYVSITLQGNGIPVVILTKSDLCNNPGRFVCEIEELSDKVRVHTVSALYGIGLDELEEYVQPGKTIAIVGSSGVGKSTLVNAFAKKEVMKTSEIREDDSKGRHTTTYRQMIELDNGAVLIDTPGMRELGMCDADEGIDETFSDIAELQAQCRFSNCAHNTEPGCAIKAALEDGTLSQERYDLYLGLHTESNNSAKMKQISKWRKQYNKEMR